MTEENSGFLIIEHMTWNGTDTGEIPKVWEVMQKGFEYRKKYVEEGKAIWYATTDNASKGVIILKTSFDEFQRFHGEDPMAGLIEQKITPLFSPMNMPEIYQNFIEKSTRIQSDGPKIQPRKADQDKMDLEITQVDAFARSGPAPDTDCNSY